MNGDRQWTSDRQILAERLRRRRSYSKALAALAGEAVPSLEQQLEILAAACGVFDGSPAIWPVTENHLAIVLAVAELEASQAGLLRARLDRFSRTFSCESFSQFHENLRTYRQSRAEFVAQPADNSHASVEPTPQLHPRSEHMGRAVAVSLLAGLALALIVAAIDAFSNVPRGPGKSPHRPIAAIPVATPTVAPLASERIGDETITIGRLDELLSQEFVVLPTPENGEVRTFGVLPRVAPLEIKAPGSSDWLVKLRSWETNVTVMTIFVRRSQTVSVKVPPGTYRVRYTGGTQWYGYRHCFGPDSACWEAAQPLTFAEEEKKTRGYTISLYDVPGANWRKRTIDLAEF